MIGIYKDKALREHVNEFHLGTVEAGIAETKIYYISNDTSAELHDFNILFPKGKPEGLEVLLPKTIIPNGTGELIVTWKPSPTFKRALSVEIKITYKELYIAEK